MKLRGKILFAVVCIMFIVFLLLVICVLQARVSQVMNEEQQLLKIAVRLLNNSVSSLSVKTPKKTVVSVLLRQAGTLEANGLLGSGWEIVNGDKRSIALKEGNKLEPAVVNKSKLSEIKLGDKRIFYLRGGLNRDLRVVNLLQGLDILLVVMLIATLLLSGVIYFLLSRLVLNPLLRLLAASKRLPGKTNIEQINTSTRKDEVGELIRAFGVMEQEVVKTRSNLEERIRQATKEIEVASRELAFRDRLTATGKLAAGIAHEINSPLGGVMNAVARIKKGGLPPEKESQYLDLISEGLQSISNIVRHMLAFARRKPTITAVNPAEVMTRALGLARHRLKKNNLELENKIPSKSPLIRVDAGELQQVFLNLVNNSIDAMAAGGKLGLTCEIRKTELVFKIIDTGSGMSEEELARSFELFQTTKPEGKGTGLGLSIANDIVNRVGGSLRLESRLGDGTTAIITLPLLSSQE